jgi:hypothetical protein
MMWMATALLLGALTLAAPVESSSIGVRRRTNASSASTDSAARAVHSHGRWRVPQWMAIARVTLTWTWRETGWRIIGALGALNVIANVVTASLGATDDAATVLLLVREHARLFLILLATIYAGELLWRDHDERVHALVASAPVSTRTLVGGRVAGMVAAQAALVGVLVTSAVLAVLLTSGARAPGLSTAGAAGGGAILWVWLPFVQWLLLSLLVHVLVRHKVIAHLVLIAGWVAAVALDANGVHAWWLRFADPPLLASGVALPWRDAIARALWWSVASAGCWWLTIRRWPRLTSPR